MYDPSQDKYLTKEEYMETVKEDSGAHGDCVQPAA